MLEAYGNILVIFLLIFVGYILTWKKWFDNKTADTFSKLVLNIALPLSMFLNITEKFTRDEFLNLMKGMLLPITSILITFLISLIYEKTTGVERIRRGAFSTMFTASNTIFIGLPINLAIFGEKAVPYVLLYYICNTTFFWTIGIMLLAGDDPKLENNKVQFDLKTTIKRILSPALLGFIIGLIWMLGKLPLPSMLTTFCSYLGGLTTPLSMFVIGIIIYNAGIKHLKIDKDVIGVLIGRYIISPLVVFLLSLVIPIPNELMLQVFIVQSAMPVQNSVPILVRNYNGDVTFAATTLSLSVLVYLAYIPILLSIIM